MEFYLIFCSSCKKLHVYQYSHARRPRKICVFCRRKFDITPKILIKGFDTAQECREAHKILSYYHNDHSRKDDLNKIQEEFQKHLREGLKPIETNLEKINGHRASPPDQMTIFDLCKFQTEVDRVHITSQFPSTLYHALCDIDSLDAHFIDLAYGTITVYTSGIVNFDVDLSDNLHLAQLEGILANFIKLSGHVGHLPIKIHDHEFTIKVSHESLLAEKIIRTLGEKTKVAFIEQSVKVYNRSEEGWAIEAQTLGDAIQVINQLWAEKLGPQGVNVLAWNEPVGKEQVQLLHKKLDAINDKQQILTVAENQSFTELLDASTEHSYALQDLKRENELAREESREREGRIESKLEDLFREKHSTRFEKKCELIYQKLQERALTLDNLEEVLGQKKQGLLRYLAHLEKEGRIVSEKVVTGERGRPKRKCKVIE